MNLSGKVTAHGSPVPGATVEISNSTGDVVDQVQVGDDGAYNFHLSAGTWTLKSWDAHGHRGGATVELAEGADTVLDLELGHEGGGH